MKSITRNLRYFLLGIPAWTIHELAHLTAYGLIKLTYFIHLDRLWEFKVNKFALNRKECILTISYTTDANWTGLVISYAPRAMYIIIPILCLLINNIFFASYMALIMTQQSLDLSFTDKKSIVKILKRRKEVLIPE